MIGRALGRASKPSPAAPYVCLSCLAKQYNARYQTRRKSTAAASTASTASPHKPVDVAKGHTSANKQPVGGKQPQRHENDRTIQRGSPGKKAGISIRRVAQLKLPEAASKKKSKNEKKQAKEKRFRSEGDGGKAPTPGKQTLVQTIKDALEAHRKSLTSQRPPKPKQKNVKKLDKDKLQSQRPVDARAAAAVPIRDSDSTHKVRKVGISVKEAMTSPSAKAAFVPASTPPGMAPLSGDIERLSPVGLELTPLDVDQPRVPHLSYGLDRVLFNPGVYHLQDERSRVYNFDPYLQKVMPVAEFDFNALTEYVTSSRDETLRDIAQKHGKKYVGSTSSMTGALSQFHFLLSQWREVNMDMMTSDFSSASSKFTKTFTAPAAIFLRWKNGIYAIDADKQFDSPNILSMLGKSLEKLLTLPKEQYERYRMSNSNHFTEEEQNQAESYHYSLLGDFLMRSQLDAHDPRLPGTGMFDLKTRAVVAIRMNVQEYEEGSGYQIRNSQGKWESFEREYYDMMRATALKYSLQVRMGRMDGIFIAYHNTERIFGFQYISLSELDRALHGQIDLTLGDQEFSMSIELLNRVLNRATEQFPGESIRLHFETREGKVPFMYIFAEPVSEEEVEEIQNTNKEKVVEFERSVLGLNKHDEAERDGWTDINAAVEEEMVIDELSAEDLEVDSGATFEEQFATVDGFAQQLSKQIERFKRVINKREATRDPSRDPDDGLEVESSKLLSLAEQLTEKTQQIRDDMQSHEEENAHLTALIDRVSDLIDQHKDDRARLSTLDGSEDQYEDEVEPADGKEQTSDLDDVADEEAEEDGDDEEGDVKEDEAEDEDEDSEDEEQNMEEQDDEEGKGGNSVGQPSDAEQDLGASEGEWPISEAFVGTAENTNAVRKELKSESTEKRTVEQGAPDTSSDAADHTPLESDATPDTISRELGSGADTETPRRVLGMTLTIRNKVDGRYVVRPTNIENKDSWTIEYSLKELEGPRANALYASCRSRRMKTFSAEQTVDPGLEFYRKQLADMSNRGREWRKEQDVIDEAKAVVVFRPLSETITAEQGQRSPVTQSPQQEEIDGVNSYLSWLYKR